VLTEGDISKNNRLIPSSPDGGNYIFIILYDLAFVKGLYFIKNSHFVKAKNKIILPFNKNSIKIT